MTKVSDAKLDGLSDKNDGLDVADVIDELLALRLVADAAAAYFVEYDQLCGDDTPNPTALLAALREAGR